MAWQNPLFKNQNADAAKAKTEAQLAAGQPVPSAPKPSMVTGGLMAQMLKQFGLNPDQLDATVQAGLDKFTELNTRLDRIEEAQKDVLAAVARTEHKHQDLSNRLDSIEDMLKAVLAGFAANG